MKNRRKRRFFAGFLMLLCLYLYGCGNTLVLQNNDTDAFPDAIVLYPSATDENLSPETATPQPETAPETAAPQPETAPETVAPQSETAPETATPQPETAPETAAPQPETAPETVAPQPETAPETAAPKPETEPETAVPKPETVPETAVPKLETEPETVAPIQETVPETATPKPETETNAPESKNASDRQSVTVPEAEETGENLVWVPTKGGKKYHSHPECSNMKEPMQVTVETALKNGYTPCKRCY